MPMMAMLAICGSPSVLLGIEDHEAFAVPHREKHIHVIAGDAVRVSGHRSLDRIVAGTELGELSFHLSFHIHLRQRHPFRRSIPLV